MSVCKSALRGAASSLITNAAWTFDYPVLARALIAAWWSTFSSKKASRFACFEVDAECTVIATLYALAQRGQLDRQVVAQALKDLGIDSEKKFPQIV